MRAICELAGGKEPQSDPYYQKVVNTNIFLTTRKTKFFPGTFRKLVPGPSKTFSRTHWNFFPDLKIYFLGQNQPPGILYNVATWWSHPELPWQFCFLFMGEWCIFNPFYHFPFPHVKRWYKTRLLNEIGIVRIWLYSISFDPNQQRRKYFWYFWSNLNSDVSGLVTPSLHKTFPHQPELEIGIVRKSQSSKLVLFVKLSNHSFRGSHRCPLGKESPLGKLGHFPQIALSFVTIISFISFQLASLGSERIGTRTQSVLWQNCKICCI